LATLPRGRVNTLAIGKQVSAPLHSVRILAWNSISPSACPLFLRAYDGQVISILVGPAFFHEYNTRRNGTISPEFEAWLACQASIHVRHLALRLVRTAHLAQRIPPSAAGIMESGS
jgi:hypothetical protein